jgi:O-antigen/teichoic acid export membrane protein
VAPPSHTDSREGIAGAALRGAGWVGASRFGGKLLFFVSTLLLARLLDKEDFGVAASASPAT